jgi:putative transposase
LTIRACSIYIASMGRPHRAAEGGYVYHVLNRANARMTIFEDEADYESFEKVLKESMERTETRLLAYCLMPNHWHLVVWPRDDGELSRFVGWLTLTHTQRWHAHRHSIGRGHLYQGRFKSFPIQEDDHLYSAGRYVERNALRAKLVRRAEQWRWCSLWRWLRDSAEDKSLLASWPVPRRPSWVDYVNAAQTEAELSALRRSVNRGSPFGDERWCERTIGRLGLDSMIRPIGRPKKDRNGS